ncbi:hypothetical protein D2V17_04190, partial [Aurantiacibacter xanthus]
MTTPVLRWIASLCAAALLTLAPTASAQAQTRAEGLWIGTLAVSPTLSLRIVVEITRKADGALIGTFDSPDQNSFGVPLADITSTNTALAFTLPAAGASYAARWSPEAEGWQGTFTQARQDWPLALQRLDPAQRPQRSALPAGWQVPA